jgi:hypothetical protein
MGLHVPLQWPSHGLSSRKKTAMEGGVEDDDHGVVCRGCFQCRWALGEERCGQRWCGGTLARMGHPLNSLDRGNELWAHLVRDGGAHAAQITRGRVGGPPGRSREGLLTTS